MAPFRLSSQQRAELALLVVSAIRGVTFPLIRQSVNTLPPSTFVTLRFTLASVAFLPVLVVKGIKKDSWLKTLPPGISLGVLNWVSYTSQTVGLKTISASRAAFITGTSILIVPLLSPLFKHGWPEVRNILSAVLGMIGLYLLTSPGGSGFTHGDYWVLLCALTVSIYIHVLQQVTRRQYDFILLAFYQVVGVALCGVASSFLTAPNPVIWKPFIIVAIFFCSLFATVGTFLLQTRYQGSTTPERTAIIFAMEPVFAFFFGFLMLNESLPALGVVGASLILLSIVGSECWSYCKRKDMKTANQDD